MWARCAPRRGPGCLGLCLRSCREHWTPCAQSTLVSTSEETQPPPSTRRPPAPQPGLRSRTGPDPRRRWLRRTCARASRKRFVWRVGSPGTSQCVYHLARASPAQGRIIRRSARRALEARAWTRERIDGVLYTLESVVGQKRHAARVHSGGKAVSGEPTCRVRLPSLAPAAPDEVDPRRPLLRRHHIEVLKKYGSPQPSAGPMMAKRLFATALESRRQTATHVDGSATVTRRAFGSSPTRRV